MFRVAVAGASVLDVAWAPQPRRPGLMHSILPTVHSFFTVYTLLDLRSNDA